MSIREMVSTHPRVRGNISEALLRCIEECQSCAQICTSCADACLAEEMVDQLASCIRKNLDCADLCVATGSIALRHVGGNDELLRATIAACAEACRICGEECADHADMHDHCRICAEACKRCEEACRTAVH